jgi:hypothetical protein
MALLNLTNYDDHPEDPNWIVFRFPDQGMAEEFRSAVAAAGLQHEVDTNGGPPFMVGVKQRHREQAVRLNYQVLGRHREPFIGDHLLRWVVLGFVGLLLALAVAGALLR